ncbi:MAG: hypothetical protein QXE00_02190 [Candidatus Bathyarchaeia archaeon]
MKSRKMNGINVGLGVAAAIIYAIPGCSAQEKPFNWKKSPERSQSAHFQR